MVAAHYVFNIEYHPKVKDVFYFLQEKVFGFPDASFKKIFGLFVCYIVQPLICTCKTLYDCYYSEHFVLPFCSFLNCSYNSDAVYSFWYYLNHYLYIIISC